MFVKVSAKTGEGIDELLDAVLPAGRGAGTEGGAGWQRHGIDRGILPGQGPGAGCHRAGTVGYVESWRCHRIR